MPHAPTLYLIDGYAQFFRAYHAIRTPMTSPVTKEPTNLTFGFVGMLLKLLRGAGRMDGPPEFLAVTLDVSGDRGTFRSTIDPSYKATRPPPPEDLPVQVERCLSILRAVGVPVLGAEAFEADDVIATVVARLGRERPEVRVRVVSKDKDLKQLLDPGDGRAGVELYDVHTDEVIDAAALLAETGLRPPQIVDMLALMGDTVDNVRGVEGVGPKTAAALIAEYGTLEALAASAERVKGKRGEALRASLDRLPINRELVRLRDDAPVDFSLDSARTESLRLDRLLPILKELGFNRYQDEVRELLVLRGEAVPADAAGTGSPSAAASAGAEGPRAANARAVGSAGGGLFDHLEPAETSHRRRGADEGDPTYECVHDEVQLTSLLDRLARAAVVSVDTETTGLSPLRADLCGVCLSGAEGEGAYVPVRSPEPASHLPCGRVLERLGPMLSDPGRPKTGHNLKFDLLTLRRAGVELRGCVFDSMVASYLIDPSRSSHSLDALALALLGRENISITELIGSGRQQKRFDEVPLDRATPYAAEDADVALRLRNLMLPQIRAMGLSDLFDRVEMPLVEVLAELEWNGVLVDPAELDRQRGRLQGRIDELRSLIVCEAEDRLGRPFNPDSPRQLAQVLFGKPTDAEPGLGLRPVKRTKTGASTDIEVLEKLAADPEITTPIPGLIVEYRQLTKLVGTYLAALKDEINPRTGRIHASFNQTVAATGRLSSSDPNLQNIPIRTDIGREIRRAFVAPPGRLLVSADYSQIELRLLAHLSRDPALIEAFHQGQDIHTAVAAQIHGVSPEAVTREQRGGAKMVNFGIVYGITPFGLARRLGIETGAAAEIIDAYKRRFAGITTFLQECIEQARSRGYVETILRRRRPIPDIESTNPSRRALAERTAINSVVQGSAADLIKVAMVDLHARLSEHAGHRRQGRPPEIPGVRMILQIHDELVFEAPQEHAEAARRLIVERMECAMDLRVPLKADSSIASDWFEGK